jgi:hypothetical protein
LLDIRTSCFLNFDSVRLINEDYQVHPLFYLSLSALVGDYVYSQI